MSESNLKKISAYVPKQVFQKLDETAKKEKISISQAIIGALVKAYEIEDIEIGRSSRRIVVGADTETKEKVEHLEQKVDNITQLLEQMLSEKQSIEKTTNKEALDNKKPVDNGKFQNQSIDKILNTSSQNKTTKQLTLDSVDLVEPFGGELIGLRLSVNKSTPYRHQKKLSEQEFKEWSLKKDPDDIAWVRNPKGQGFIPYKEITKEQLLNLKQWVTENG